MKTHYGANGIYSHSTLIAPMEKAWFYERLIFEVAMVMVKDEIKDTV